MVKVTMMEGRWLISGILTVYLLVGTANSQTSIYRYCKVTDAGREFAGNLAVTKSGKACQSWGVQTPNPHSFTDGKLYPDGSAAAAGNRCRNPDNSFNDGPWCYTTDPNVRWELCDVPKCVADTSPCKTSDAGRDYAGNVFVTKSGKICQSWGAQNPNPHSFTAGNLYPDGSADAAGNRCRNPDNSFTDGPWCYTTDSTVRWEICDIPKCVAPVVKPACKTTWKGETFIGNLTITKSNKTCQAWSSQYPQQHNLTADSLFADGRVSAAANNCRNPGGVMPDGPWCFTNDNATRWEYCAMDLCPEVKSMCKTTQVGGEFKGNLNKTISGKPCQAWSSQSPNPHGYTSDSLYPDGSVIAAGNNCRNPDPGFTSGPWCYTTDPSKAWDVCDVQFCPKPSGTFCKDSAEGREFKGQLSMTKSNRTCQSWSSQSPNAHNYTQNSMFPDGSATAAVNYCRNPDPNNKDGPWCYVNDPSSPVKFEQCNVPLCPNSLPPPPPPTPPINGTTNGTTNGTAPFNQTMCKLTDPGREFSGNLTVTKSGKACQSWGVQSPNPHSFTDGKLYPDGSAAAAGNRCRNPDNSFNDGPWCYTTDPNVRWELCDVPKCDPSTLCKKEWKGDTFRGYLTVTKSGKTCQAWSSQAPQQHNFTNSTMFPDGGAIARGNSCRNPGGVMPDGPWCFTNDNATRWEYCNVDLCPEIKSMCKTTQVGGEFKGNLTKTIGGKPCQAWSSQSPNPHGYTSDSLYPDGSVIAAGNNCRNPDPGFTSGPWCYINDPNKGWDVCDVKFCPTNSGMFCKDSAEGREFKGQLSMTKSNRTCQSWSSQSPNAHNYTQNSMFPDGSATAAVNYCRNPDPNNKDGPWCYVNDPSSPVKFEQCNVPLCPNSLPPPPPPTPPINGTTNGTTNGTAPFNQTMCKLTDPGREFSGNLTVTKSGKACQSWGVQSPNPHSFTDGKLYPDGSAAAAGNRCRNPDNSFNDGPWCYTTDPNVRWELCDVPKCDPSTLCKKEWKGDTFRGYLTVTKSGKTCQAWSAQAPQQHNFTNSTMFSDGGAVAAGNSCRNPGGVMPDGPWCFTNDNATRWEYCAVDLCPEIKSMCKTTQVGGEFKGNLTKTIGGKPCQAWSSQSPNPHGYTSDSLYPDGSVIAAGSNCRNPDPGFTSGPWCYINDPNKGWDVCDVKFCPMNSGMFCKDSAEGREFKGQLSMTKSNRTCQSWSSQSPNTHNYTQNSMFPDGSAAAAVNYCRNPDPNNKDGPWCYVNDPSSPVKFEQCNVPLCPNALPSPPPPLPPINGTTNGTTNGTIPNTNGTVPFNQTLCKLTDPGREFSGNLTVTKSGKACQSWGVQSPNPHSFTDGKLYPDGSAAAAGNRCRNPDNSFNDGPWCYTTDPNVRWELCDVPKCDASTLCKKEWKGDTFRGYLTVTKSGKTCQAWSAQAPQQHNFTNSTMFPDGGAVAAGNSCRNPGGVMPDGPWCFTNDNATRWEYCAVDLCPEIKSMCKTTQVGGEFKGNLTKTIGGKPCQAWSSQSPNPHGYTSDSLYPDGSVVAAGNNCRNPDPGFTSGPWCYINDPNKGWDVCDVKFCPTNSGMFCKDSAEGREFKGQLSMTKSNRTCQSWSSQSPNAHNYTQNSMFPDGSATAAVNYCRNPDPNNKDGPWCYVNDPSSPVKFEQCNVPLCPNSLPPPPPPLPPINGTTNGTTNGTIPNRNGTAPFNQTMCKLTDPGREFSGNLTVTKSGKACQSWGVQSPNPHSFTDGKLYPDGSAAAAGNRCRNPDNSFSDGPWCYTTDPNVRWELCDVPKCSDVLATPVSTIVTKPQTPCKLTDAGREFSGNVNVTKSGKPCQSWDSQSPYTHPFTNGSLFPDGNITIAGNRCRNPEINYSGGPWCYAIDDSVRWEVCDIPKCESSTLCKKEWKGDTFRGYLTVTKSGKTCQAWSAQAPQQHNFTKDSMYPDGGAIAAGNSCRNPGGVMPDGPWCFTNDNATRWEYCAVDLCPEIKSMCKTTQVGGEFKGNLTKTISGKPCQAWSSQSPNPHGYTSDSLYPDGSVIAAGNNCRNPDPGFTSGPWCYTTDPSKAWEVCDVQFCPTNSGTFCKDSFEGREFKGQLSMTKSNRTCQSWSSQSPNTHNYTQNSMFPDGSAAAAVNYCRNPDPNNKDGPWCYVNDPSSPVKFEQCNVPLCPNALPAPPPPTPPQTNGTTNGTTNTTNPVVNKPCKVTDAGREFAGNVTVTKSGKVCQSWGVQTPNQHSFTDGKLYPDGSAAAAGNRCRNPDNSFNDGPWCYTLDATVRWELCDVPKCVADPNPCKKSDAGRDYAGNVFVTKSGKTCQSWGAQNPNPHSFTAGNLYPDGSADAAGNRCRNPDNSFTDGPWCYTTDSTVRWELCNITKCATVINKDLCKNSTTGHDFRGNITQTKSGRTCQRWDSQTPYSHNFTADFMFPDGSSKAAGNMCRNPDVNFTSGPWCFTTDPTVRMEVCDVPLCPKTPPPFCKDTQAGREFQGNLTVTKSGKPCQRWSDQSPQKHSYTDGSFFPEKNITLAADKCRNPDPWFNDGPWCYTTDPNTPWELCDVPMCPKDGDGFCKKTPNGRDFLGDLRETRSGRVCQAWSTQTPNRHNFTINAMFADKSVIMADNRCRNPDSNFTAGPWCYTVDPAVPWELCNVTTCPVAAPSFCKQTYAGREFKGHLAVTKSGRTCQNWTDQFPNRHNYTDDRLYPDGSALNAGNRCRNPDPNYFDGPWCYTTDPAVPWELCDVTLCSNQTICKETMAGREFKGDLRVTKSNRTCQSWKSQSPWTHNFTSDFMFPDLNVSLAENKCRNPDPTFPDGPWCFTTDPSVRIELCDVPTCQLKPPSFCKETQAGREFIGHLTVTKTGKPCQSWASQSPNPHTYTSNSSYPDKSVELAGNRCRNPEPTFNNGPWCFTTDVNARWEECDVPMCPTLNQTFCKKTKEGFEFQGNLRLTKSGKFCQNWYSQTPNKHNFTDNSMFPDGSALIAGDRCRNPDRNFTDGPWCFTTDPNVPRELCDVPMCPETAPPVQTFCKQTRAGREFTGTLTVTRSGRPCQSWGSQSPNTHSYVKDSLYPEGSAKIADNRCRNPDPQFGDGPWCYFADGLGWELCNVTDCHKPNKTYCKESSTGRDFKGDLRQTMSGKTCQRWDSQTPQPHNFTSDYMYADGSAKAAENMCRNPDPNYRAGPWCFTTDVNTTREPCNVPMCEVQLSFCKQTPAGREFMGHLTVTKSGRTCQRWDQQTPNSHNFLDPNLFPEGNLTQAGNQCRNPDSSYSTGPWCYTTDPSVKWEECDVPLCPKENATFCKATDNGRTFTGNLRETKSGRICQNWTSQAPQTHSFTVDNQFADGSVKLAENRCRNPDASYMQGPWCFTVDPQTRWEDCDVKLCDAPLPVFCKTTIPGRDFKGHLAVTKSGRQCQSWAAQSPNAHPYTNGSMYPDGSVERAGNQCRNPDSSFNDGPWCYTTDPAVPWELCDVQMCPKPDDYFCKNSTEGRDFSGNLATTKSGRSCQSWSSQNRTTYPFIKDSAFPDGTVDKAGNRCRNPDPSIADGPWCFTTDPLVKWEFCNVPLCEAALSTYCKTTKAGREFRGHLTVTKSGRACQSWGSQTPNNHSYIDGKLFPDGNATAAGNRCRNPDNFFNDGPWCYTTDPNVRWELCDVPMCNVQSSAACKDSDAGREFKGNVRVTKSGFTCQAWNIQSPNVHNFSQDALFPDGSVAAAENRCRNPDSNNQQGPWCYTTDKTVKLEQCNVPLCPKTVGPCKTTQGGMEFQGNVTVTRSGRQCQAWSSQSPNKHTYTDSQFPDKNLTAAGNMCRNPDPSFLTGPWCYTTDPKVPWEICDIPNCPTNSPFCKRSMAGREFQGHLSITKSGKQCQSWSSQTPNQHIFTLDSAYPDGSVALAGDRCRNPDPTHSDGPWCYTMDPVLRWEACDVPLCDDVKLDIPLCKNTQAGRDFMGNLNVTTSGKTCQNWAAQTPQRHNYTSDSLYPDGSAAKAGARCRNPDIGFTDGPWCYTTDTNTTWEKCNVPMCEHVNGFCKTTAEGSKFMGHLTTTIGGHTCQNWDSQTPNTHSYTQDSMYPDGSVKLAGNKCRNPDTTFTEGPWCYVVNSTVRWEKCDVPMC